MTRLTFRSTTMLDPSFQSVRTASLLRECIHIHAYAMDRWGPRYAHLGGTDYAIYRHYAHTNAPVDAYLCVGPHGTGTAFTVGPSGAVASRASLLRSSEVAMLFEQGGWQ